MTDVVLYEGVAEGRDLNDPNLFSGITTSTFTVTDSGESEIVLHFTPDLTADELRQVNWRISMTPTEETIYRNLRGALVDLRTITATTGTLTAAQLSAAVRLLAGVEIGLIRLRLGDLSSTT